MKGREEGRRRGGKGGGDLFSVNDVDVGRLCIDSDVYLFNGDLLFMDGLHYCL